MAGRRTPHREAHLAHVTEAAEKGDLLIGGALEELDGGVMVSCVVISEELAPMSQWFRLIS
jgi:uncharacterized protein YciI